MTEKSETTSAATDVSEFITDLDGGVFDRKLSIALSQVAAAKIHPLLRPRSHMLTASAI